MKNFHKIDFISSKRHCGFVFLQQFSCSSSKKNLEWRSLVQRFLWKMSWKPCQKVPRQRVQQPTKEGRKIQRLWRKVLQGADPSLPKENLTIWVRSASKKGLKWQLRDLKLLKKLVKSSGIQWLKKEKLGETPNLFENKPRRNRKSWPAVQEGQRFGSHSVDVEEKASFLYLCCVQSEYQPNLDKRGGVGVRKNNVRQIWQRWISDSSEQWPNQVAGRCMGWGCIPLLWSRQYKEKKVATGSEWTQGQEYQAEEEDQEQFAKLRDKDLHKHLHDMATLPKGKGKETGNGEKKKGRGKGQLAIENGTVDDDEEGKRKNLMMTAKKRSMGWSQKQSKESQRFVPRSCQ